VSVGYLVQALLCLKMYPPKMQHTETKNIYINSGEGTAPSPDRSPIWDGDPSQNPTPLDAYGASIRPPAPLLSSFGPSISDLIYGPAARGEM